MPPWSSQPQSQCSPSSSSRRPVSHPPSTFSKQTNPHIHVCPHCNVHIGRAPNLVCHVRACTTRLPQYHCPEPGCAFAMLYIRVIEIHSTRHDEMWMSHGCPMCWERFESGSALAWHRRAAHGYVPLHIAVWRAARRGRRGARR